MVEDRIQDLVNSMYKRIDFHMQNLQDEQPLQVLDATCRCMSHEMWQWVNKLIKLITCYGTVWNGQGFVFLFLFFYH